MPSLDVRRPMMRCASCRAWWSGPPVYAGINEPRKGQPLDPDEVMACGCGGELVRVDMNEHTKSLPYVPFDPSKDKTPGSAPGGGAPTSG